MSYALFALGISVASLAVSLVMAHWLKASRRATVRVQDQRIRKVLDLE